jgi:hypothetical protein
MRKLDQKHDLKLKSLNIVLLRKFKHFPMLQDLIKEVSKMSIYLQLK